MKPITLTVSGLHSFREKQIIDFRTLCEGGVFGIFGPTGSGKSSILDAMTLALYGKVERAANNTLGILNHAEDQLHVSLTFELENATGVKRYVIERSFKRADEVRVKSAISRLIEVSEESVVLADKIGEVNQQIHELLGLTIEDFTRAVVLPQGKFAEFLSLKGADRRQMLQRLFNLEQYGDKLNKKLKNKLTLAKSELNEVMAEQTGLGDASAEAITDAQKELKDIEVLLEKRQTELTRIEEQYESTKRLWEWQEQKEVLQKEIQQVEQQKENILGVESKLKKAESADRVVPYLDEYEEATKGIMYWANQHESLRTLFNSKKEENEKSLELYQKARLEKSEKLPKYITKRQQLSDAKLVQEKLTATTVERNELQQRVDSLLEKSKTTKGLLDKVTDVIERAQEKQTALKEQITTKTVAADYREELRQAFDRRQLILHNRESLKEILEERDKKQIQVEEAFGFLESNKAELSKLKQRVETLFKRNERTYHLVCEKEVLLERLSVLSEKEISSLKKRVEETRAKSLAFHLASQLKAGEACPVCGSMDHPNPLLEHDDLGQALEQKIDHLESGVRLSRELKQEFAALRLQLEQISQGLVQEFPGEVALEIRNIQPINSPIETTDLSMRIEAELVEKKSLHQDYLSCKADARQVIQDIRVAMQQRVQLENSIELTQKDFVEIKLKAAKLSEKVDAQLNEWTNTFREIEYETVEKKMEEISLNDKEAQELSKRIETSILFLNQKEQERQRLVEEYNNLEKGIAELGSSLRNKEEIVVELQDRLIKEVGENDINQLILQTDSVIKLIEENESKAYEEWQKVQNNCQQLENEVHAAAQSRKESQTRYDKALKKWNDIVMETSFLTADDVRAAIIPLNEQILLKRSIEEYWDKIKQIQAELTKINDLIRDECISLEKWEELQRVREEMKTMHNEVVEAKGAAMNALQVLQEKHSRFKDLEARRIELASLVEQYNKLQSVFKGNSFVEYIAEEQLVQVCRDATERLGHLTRQRYAVEVDSQGGFIMRDDANGGVRRPVTTLSGGETFLTSLALALSLSAQVQLRGEYPLQFFFLDEGFGTLDADLLDTVVSALEKIHSEKLAVGVISHVQELRSRLPKRLIVEPAEHSGRGTVVRVEKL